MLISSSKALFPPLPRLTLSLRTFTSTAPALWKRKSASLRTLPMLVKMRTHKAVANRWTVLPSEASNRPRFIRARAGLNHGITRRSYQSAKQLRGYAFNEPEHVRQLKESLPYYRKMAKREPVD